MASRANLLGILTNLKSIFDTANTTTGSPIDLSSDMSRRVNTVLTYNPNLIRPEANIFPLVTCFITGKEISDETMGKSQANIKRRATLSVDVVGAVWNDTYNAATDDPADKDIHYLMENIELILRSNEVISGVASWSMPDGVEYYNVVLAEDSHLRSGVIGLKATIYY